MIVTWKIPILATPDFSAVPLIQVDAPRMQAHDKFSLG